MSIQWYEEFLQRLREFRVHCADTLRAHEDGSPVRLNTQPILRAVDALERHWKKQFPQHGLPKRDQIDRHLRIGEPVDILDLMTKDIHDAEVKALSALGDRRAASRLPYVAQERIEELALLQAQSRFDLSKTLRLCEELNAVAERDCHIATVALVRALIDHVPPAFNVATFKEVCNNYAGSRSFLAAAKNLDDFSRKIADGLLHTQMRKQESLPTDTQVDFRPALDVLLGELSRVLRGSPQP